MKFVWFFVAFYILSTSQGGKCGLLDFAERMYNLDIPHPLANGLWKVASNMMIHTRTIVPRVKGPPVRTTTKMGVVVGSLMKSCRRGQQYVSYFGMPYAKPPLGSLRFKAPVPADPWDGEYDATFERPSCMQLGGSISEDSEDCLYINVYTPHITMPANPKSVMIFIYGGAFMGGSSKSDVYAPDLFVENDVILVTFNYRLGPLGFLSMQTSDIPGNAGLKDQRLAFEWVQKNIRSFGGDPNSVTIFGESAGSASVNFHILSNASAGLFQRAILESGTALSPWAFLTAEDAVKNAAALAKKLGCPTTGYSMADCLRKVSAEKITLEQEKSLTLTDVLTLKPVAFVPTIEPNVKGAFLTKQPIDILTSKTFNPVPVIIGFNSREGLLILPGLKTIDPLNIAVNLLSYNLCSFFPPQAKPSLTDKEKNYLNSALRKFYLNVKPAGYFNPLKVADIITDTAFMVPSQLLASFMASTSQPVYNYVFTYDGEYGYYKKGMKIKEEGVCHVDELGYLFYNEEFRWSVNETRYAEAEKVANMVSTMWTNFAKTGNPTPANTGLHWPPREKDNVIYAEIGNVFRTGPELSAGMDGRYKFWVKLIFDIVQSIK